MIPIGGLCVGLSQGDFCFALGADLLDCVVGRQILDTIMIPLIQSFFLRFQLPVGSLLNSVLHLYVLLVKWVALPYATDLVGRCGQRPGFRSTSVLQGILLFALVFFAIVLYNVTVRNFLTVTLTVTKEVEYALQFIR